MGKSWELASQVNFDSDNLTGGRPHPNPPPEGEGILWFSWIILLLAGRGLRLGIAGGSDEV